MKLNQESDDRTNYQEDKEKQNKIINYILLQHFPFAKGKRKNNLVWYLQNLYGNNLLNNKEINKRIRKQEKGE